MDLIQFDQFNRPIQPEVYISELDYTIIGDLKVSSFSGRIKDYLSTITFIVPFKYTDNNGCKINNPYYNKVEAGRFILVENVGWFVLSEPKIISDGISEYKECTAISEEKKFAEKKLYDFRINLGTNESIEWIYAREKYPSGIDFNPFDVELTEDQKQEILDGYTDDFIIQRLKDDLPGDISYVKFCNESKPHLSLLHILLSYMPNWTLGHVDYSLKKLIRHFDIDSIDILSFMTGKISESYDCTFVFDILNHKVNVYEKDNIGKDTDIFVDFNKLAKSIEVLYDDDDIKTKLRVNSNSGFSIRDVNGGNASIVNLGYYHNEDWMKSDLCLRYSQWIEESKKADQVYTSLMQKVYDINFKFSEVNSSFLIGYDFSIEDAKDENGEYTADFNAKLQEVLDENCDHRFGEKYSEDITLKRFLQFYNQDVEEIYKIERAGGHFQASLTLMWEKMVPLIGTYYLTICQKSYQQVLDALNESFQKEDTSIKITLKSDGTVEGSTKISNQSIGYNIDAIRQILEVINKTLTERSVAAKEQSDEYQRLITEATDAVKPYQFDNFFNEKEKKVLSNMIKEDEYSPDGFEMTANMTVEDMLVMEKELKDQAEKELERISQPRFECTVDSANIYEIPEFHNILADFNIHSYITVMLRDDYHLRAKIIEIAFNFDDKTDFSFTLCNVSLINDFAKKLHDATSSAVSIANSVASAQSSINSVINENRSNFTLIDDIRQKGLNLAVTEIKSDNNQDVLIDNYGIHLRRRKVSSGEIIADNDEDSPYEYEPEQGWIVHNKFLYSDDGFETAKSLYGRMYLESHPDGYYKAGYYYGLIADMVVSGVVQGSLLIGNNLIVEGHNATIQLFPEEGISITNKTTKEKQFYVDVDGNVRLGAGAKISWSPSNTEGLSEYFATKSDVTNLGDIIGKQDDGRINTYYTENGNPENDPAIKNNWTAQEKQDHIGDLWKYPDPNDPRGYIIKRYNGTGWDIVEDDIPSCIFDDIDGKSTVFITLPTSYEVNDYYILETNRSPYKIGDMLVAIKSRSNTYVFHSEDWKKVTQYGIDYDNMSDDNIITPPEKIQLKEELLRIQQEYNTVIASSASYDSSLISNLRTRYNALSSMIQTITSNLNDNYVLGTGGYTKTTFDNTFSNYYEAYGKVISSIADKTAEIQKTTNDIAKKAEALANSLGIKFTTEISDKYVISPEIIGGEIHIFKKDANGNIITSAEINNEGVLTATGAKIQGSITVDKESYIGNWKFDFDYVPSSTNIIFSYLYCDATGKSGVGMSCCSTGRECAAFWAGLNKADAYNQARGIKY